jgi:hypothetical protein
MTDQKLVQIAAFALLASALSISGAAAQATHRPFDGMWVLDVPPSPVIARTSETACPALRLPVSIENDQLVGSLMRVPTPDAGPMLEAGTGPNAAPIVGSVAADGTVQAHWEGFQVYGKLTGGTGQVTVQTMCGPMVSTATRLDVPPMPATAEVRGTVTNR